MPEQHIRSERRLSAILAADVAGYSRLMGVDDEGTLRALNAHRRELIDPAIAERRGRVVKTTGDGILIEFPSVVAAVECAVAVQRGMAERNESVPAARRMDFRVGINLGDVIVEGEDIFGDGVNVAARLQELAAPGGVALSRAARDQVRDKLDVTFEDMGEKQLKNIARPVRVYRIAGASAPAMPIRTARWRRSRMGWLGAAAAVAVIVLAASLYLPRGLPTGPTLDSARAGTPLPLPDRPSIAVLPFTNLSDDARQDYFSDGVTEDLITALSKFRELFVIARNSSFVYKGKAVNISEVGRTLGVRYVLEGSVRREQDRVRVTAQLIDAVSGTHVWAERYDREVKEIFALQDEITERIATTLVSWMRKAEIGRTLRKGAQDWRAHDFYLRGAELERLLRSEWKLEHLAEARRNLEKAIEIDPGYAPPYAVLARTYISGFTQPWGEDFTNVASLDRAVELARKAVALDPLLPLAYDMLGDTLVWKRQFDEALDTFRRLFGLNPHYVSASHANALVAAGQHREALEVLKRVSRLDPFAPAIYRFYEGRALYFLGRYEEALAALTEFNRIAPRHTGGLIFLATTHAQLGNEPTARRHMEALLRVDPGRTIRNNRQRTGPLVRAEDWARFEEGMRRAGFPE